ncbi:hypothetical protein PUNSTDRAFT_113575 [Punctularia strigosozonata HHB-11173 SS5]|uniref:uncharacterized protein n=1 Tax=Punctularia strigosozonata (strain HHB-11173) TaxID=741275 RepID=UPI000441716C|nr:uncharacterized protein PUNSTDRAFT_113575 [Punctularia strigosozonata HHB-11173 SS5]EIN09031.1 hypothetical protein PUNSTDRAFT_113575 [Punctularia strigosozonata HHB-11173 SS5]
MMDDDHEALDWGAGDDDGSMAPHEYDDSSRHPGGSAQEGEDEDAVSVGGDEDDMDYGLFNYTSGGVANAPRDADRQSAQDEPEGGQGAGGGGGEQAPARSPPHEHSPSRERDSRSGYGNGDRTHRSGGPRNERGRNGRRTTTLMPPPDTLTHALPPKPVAAPVVPPPDSESMRGTMRPHAKPMGERKDRNERRNGRAAASEDELDAALPPEWEVRRPRNGRPDEVYYYNTATRESTWDRPGSGIVDEGTGRGRRRDRSRSLDREEPHHRTKPSDRSEPPSSRARDARDGRDLSPPPSREDRRWRSREGPAPAREPKQADYGYSSRQRDSRSQRPSGYEHSEMLVSAEDAKANRRPWGPDNVSQDTQTQRFPTEPELETDRRWTPRGEPPPRVAVQQTSQRRERPVSPLTRRGAYTGPNGADSRAAPNRYEERLQNVPNNDHGRWPASSTRSLTTSTGTTTTSCHAMPIARPARRRRLEASLLHTLADIKMTGHNRAAWMRTHQSDRLLLKSSDPGPTKPRRPGQALRTSTSVGGRTTPR